MPLKAGEAIYRKPHCEMYSEWTGTFRRSSGFYSSLVATRTHQTFAPREMLVPALTAMAVAQLQLPPVYETHVP